MHRFPRWTAAAAVAAGDGTDRGAVALGEGGEGLCRAAVEGAAVVRSVCLCVAAAADVIAAAV